MKDHDPFEVLNEGVYRTHDPVGDGFVVGYKARAHHLDFEVQNVCGECEQTGELIFEEELLMCGTLKWDGCIDLDVGAGQSFQLHFCGFRHALVLQRAMTAIYGLGEKLIPNFDASLAR